MMKAEFENLVRKEISPEEFKVINSVYTFHPSISEIDGKREIAELYTKYGLSVIQGMAPAAKAFELLEDHESLIKNKIEVLEIRLTEIREAKKALKDGHFDPHTVIQDINALVAEEEVFEDHDTDYDEHY